jgi:hypothetical protein
LVPRLAPKSETKEVPNVEWWDALILENPEVYDENHLRVEALTNLGPILQNCISAGNFSADIFSS